MVVMTADDAKEYVASEITPTLTKALAALCKERPKDPVTFLANTLIALKPPPPALSITEAFRSAVLQVFALADEDGSGALEFREVYTIATHQQEAVAILRHLDQNQDGVISEAEVCLALTRTHYASAQSTFSLSLSLSTLAPSLAPVSSCPEPAPLTLCRSCLVPAPTVPLSDTTHWTVVHVPSPHTYAAALSGRAQWESFFMGLFERNQAAAEGLLQRSVHMIFEREFMQICLALFQEFDKDGSGTLELNEVLVMMGDDEQVCVGQGLGRGGVHI
jgi:hypothetical protein